jgi:hypothetical protein
MELNDSLLYSQDPAIGLYSEQGKSGPRSSIVFL